MAVSAQGTRRTHGKVAAVDSECAWQLDAHLRRQRRHARPHERLVVVAAELEAGCDRLQVLRRHLRVYSQISLCVDARHQVSVVYR